MYLLISTPQNNRFSVATGEEAIEDFKIVKKEYKQSEFLLKTIDNLQPNNLQAVFVVEGPGAFSSLRIGIATANALAYAVKVPVVGVGLQKGWDKLAEKEKLKKIWQAGLRALSKTKKGEYVKPFYGKDPNITVKKVSN